MSTAYTKAANMLDDLQSTENQGRGISCVRSIIHYLRLGDFESAKSIRRTEGDKTRSYPGVEAALAEVFGCRIHGTYNCPTDFCKHYAG